MVFDGPAVFTPSTHCFPGDLRDWFAGQALIAWRWRVHGDIGSPEQLAKLAYAQADAMLKAREKSNG